MPQTGPAQIRALIFDALVDIGAREDAKEMESLLIRSGKYCGHRIEKDGCRAIWFIEEDQIKLFGNNGQLIRVLNPSKIMHKKAA